MAIKTAVEICKDLTHKLFIISDSKSGLQKLERKGILGNSDHSYLDTRQEIVKALHSGLDIKFAWVPGHSGIAGNVKADELALKERESGFLIANKIHSTSCFKEIKDYPRNNWDKIYALMGRHKGVAYYKILKKPLKKPWFYKLPYIKRKHITLHCRMRSLHCLTASHLFKIKLKDGPYCECRELGDLNHCILGCNNDPNSRLIYNTLARGMNAPFHISEILENPHTESALKLCKLLGRLDRII